MARAHIATGASPSPASAPLDSCTADCRPDRDGPFIMAAWNEEGWLETAARQPLFLLLKDGESRTHRQRALEMTLGHLDDLVETTTGGQSGGQASQAYRGSGHRSFTSLLLRNSRRGKESGSEDGVLQREGERSYSKSDVPESSDSDADEAEDGQHCQSGVSVQQVWALVDTEGKRLLRRLRRKVNDLHASEMTSRRGLKRSRKQRNKEDRGVTDAAADASGFFHDAAEGRQWKERFLWLLPEDAEETDQEVDFNSEEAEDPRGQDEEDQREGDEEEEEGIDDAEGYPEKQSRTNAEAASEEASSDSEAGDSTEPGGTSEGGDDKKDDDPFFSMEEMQRFVLQEEEKELRRLNAEKKGPLDPAGETDEEEASDEDDLCWEEPGDDDDEARNMKFSDFFDDPVSGKLEKEDDSSFGKEKKRKTHLDEENSQEGDDSADEEKGFIFEEGEMDEEERRLQCELDRLERRLREEEKDKQRQQKGQGDRDSTDVEEDDSDDASSSLADSAEEERSPQDGRSLRNASLREVMARSTSLQSDIDKLERELVSKKAWNLQGEAWAKQRPRNALLDIGPLDLPLLGASVKDEKVMEGDGLGKLGEGDDEQDEAQKISKLSEYIENVVRRRIDENLFDDVVRRAVVPPNKASHQKDDPGAELDMEKSKVGLGDLYAIEYEKQVLGGEAGGSGKMSAEEKQKAELLEMFGSLMYKLDCLSNMSFRPAPAAVAEKAKLGGGDGIAAVQVEEAVPVLLSGAMRKAPEELRKASKDKEKDEMTQAERKAERRNKKERRRKRVLGQVRRGELTKEGLKERETKLAAKNKEQKANKLNKKQTGLTQQEALAELRKNQRRVKVQELLSDAMKAIRKERRQKAGA
ncbi:putative M phase phosphoprotein MPP10 [Toxoplasma gondii TgCatPRC2]|uniref:Putative M phase phosphoprotein MPP10 n=1 Tax=Toxoplasma gondii TgCatPRC2 TaxID=1130821 RepID=A0A151HKT1_TOXGO|nr:putative M phase phosphoprotein MPP10 [Toxoplasma gondii TgCatPRC2]